jgi:hypothetical protein
MLGLCGLTTGSAQQTTTSREVFAAVAPNKLDLTPKQHTILDNLKRHASPADIQIVTVNTNALESATPGVLLNVTKDVRFEASVEKSSEKGATVLTGKMKSPLDSAVFINRDGNITGTIRADGKFFSVKPLGAGLHAIIREDESKFPPEHPPSFKKIEEKAGSPENRMDVKPHTLGGAAGPWVVRVLVAYTPEANSTVADMNGVIQLAVAETNQSYQNSKINLRAELADSYQVSYSESPDFDTNLNDFAGKSDGKMDEVHGRRDQSKADICVLLIKNDAYCGLADAIMAKEDSAFAAVCVNCATGYYSFAHEIGHLQGARHNPEMDPTTSPFQYGHGYYYEPAKWRTIMSYACPSNCTRLPFWSNPSINNAGHPMGTAGTHDNARVLNETAPIITAFRN